MILKSKSDHVPIQDSREGVSEEVTFELQDEASHVRYRGDIFQAREQHMQRSWGSKELREFAADVTGVQ